MTTLRLLTAGPRPNHGCQHGYQGKCEACVTDRASREPAQCRCDRQARFADPTADYEIGCLTCGRPVEAPMARAA